MFPQNKAYSNRVKNGLFYGLIIDRVWGGGVELGKIQP